MVKADPKHDYYADLELPDTADAETIKKQFRLLAKQYHPDRNPGKEIEVIPKFQAIQAANEILSDPLQKQSYDRERKASELKANDTSAFKKPAKPGKPPPPPSNFPPPPRRTPNPLRAHFGAASNRPNSSPSAEKFAQFTRQAPPQQWDRAKYEDAAKAEALRNLNNMRPQSQGPPPRVPPRGAPTAPKPPPRGPSPDVSHASGSGPGFPGLSRTNSGRRAGFAPGTPSNEETTAPPSAYAYVHRPPPPPAGYSYSPSSTKSGMASSSTGQRARPDVSPLRTSKSSGFEDVQRPSLQRPGSRYATSSGERTDVNGPGLTRSASVRNSPVSQHWDESGPFGRRPQSQQQNGPKQPPPRHHSSSPRGRSANFQFSASESSSSEDEELPPRNNRPKATPRRPQPPPRNSNEPALTGQFQFGNYNTKTHDEKQWYYPPPDADEGPRHRNFSEPSASVGDTTQNSNKSGVRHVHREDVPLKSQTSFRPNGVTSEGQTAAQNSNSAFSAADWDGKFMDGDAFRPTESTSRSRSPTKPNRPKLPNRSRGANRSQSEKEEEGNTNDEAGPNIPGVRHVVGTSDSYEKQAAFQPGKFSAEDWAQRLRSQSDNTPTQRPPPPKTPSREKTPQVSKRQPTVHDEVEVEEFPSSPERSVPQRTAAVGPDAMDIDDSVPQQKPTTGETGRGRTPADTAAPRATSNGVNLKELGETVPFQPAANGLGSLGDLNDQLPFESRAAEQLNLHQAPSYGPAAHQLKLPPPPKPVPPPDEMCLDQDSWSTYSAKMGQYMHDWNLFNCKMIDHFRIRQQQIHLSMYHNWLTAVGDGASAGDFDGLDFVGSESGVQEQTNGKDVNKPKKAGYATYMEWLKQDRVCRTWWEVAFDEHTKCMEDLGRIRKLVKYIRSGEPK